MLSLTDLLTKDAANLWLFAPSAIALGALHGLEPGHSKTMMAAFIVAVRGTVGQAVLLGLSATASHTLVVWLVGLAGLYFGRNFRETDEPYFQLASALMIMAVAAWMLWRISRTNNPRPNTGHHDHPHDHHHGHDAHQQAHAQDIQERLAGGPVTTGQIVMFGITGGLIPCPAAITVLLLCLHLKALAAGVVLVLCFSIGLAITMVAAGVLAALGAKRAAGHWPGFDIFLRRAPYASSLVILVVGGFLAIQSARAIWG